MVVTASPMLLVVLILLVIGLLVIAIWLVNRAGLSIKKKSHGERSSVQFSPAPSGEPLETSLSTGTMSQSQHDLSTRQRELLRIFRQAETLRQEAQSQYEAGRAELQRVGLTYLLENVRVSVPPAVQGANSIPELGRSATATRQAAADLRTAVDALLRWRERRRKMIAVATALSITLCIALVIAGYLAYRPLWLAWHYQQAISAIQAQQWDQAADEVLRISEYDSNYQDLPGLIATYPGLLQAMEARYSDEWLTGRIVRRATLKGHRGGVGSVAFSPDGRTMASSAYDTVFLWDVTTGSKIATLAPSGNVSGIAFSPDGRMLATGHDDKTTILWDTAKVQHIATFEGHPNLEEGDQVRGVAFSPDGTLLASGTCREVQKRYYQSGGGYYYECVEGEILVWQAADRTLLHALEVNEGQVNSVAFSPDGRTLASAGESVVLWDLATGQRVATLDENSSVVAFSPDGRTLALGVHYSAVLWDWTTGQRVATLA